jgi:hypothetical protein
MKYVSMSQPTASGDVRYLEPAAVSPRDAIFRISRSSSHDIVGVEATARDVVAIRARSTRTMKPKAQCGEKQCPNGGFYEDSSCAF